MCHTLWKETSADGDINDCVLHLGRGTSADGDINDCVTPWKETSADGDINDCFTPWKETSIDGDINDCVTPWKETSADGDINDCVTLCKEISADGDINDCVSHFETDKIIMFGTSLVERYLYSLPEYRMELHRSNFIEIYSYNGLLATRKIIGNCVFTLIDDSLVINSITGFFASFVIISTSST